MKTIFIMMVQTAENILHVIKHFNSLKVWGYPKRACQENYCCRNYTWPQCELKALHIHCCRPWQETNNGHTFHLVRGRMQTGGGPYTSTNGPESYYQFMTSAVHRSNVQNLLEWLWFYHSHSRSFWTTLPSAPILSECKWSKKAFQQFTQICCAFP